MSDYMKCIHTGSLEFGDDFATQKEVLDLFGLQKGKGKEVHGVYDLPGSGNVKVCLFKGDERGGWHHWRKQGDGIDRRGWNEATGINDFCDDQDEALEYVQSEMDNPSTRYVFYKMEWKGMTWWKFFGVFELDQEVTNSLNHPPMAFRDWFDGYRCYFKRVSKKLDLNRAAA